MRVGALIRKMLKLDMLGHSLVFARTVTHKTEGEGMPVTSRNEEYHTYRLSIGTSVSCHLAMFQEQRRITGPLSRSEGSAGPL